jgi:SET domain-containing protein
MITVRCYLAPSAIEQLGVFAADPIQKGEVAWRFDPLLDQMIPEEVLAARPLHVREFLERYGYPHHERPGISVLDADEGRFMNHSEAPNLDFSTPEIGIALCDIPADVELTSDYADFTIGEVIHQPPRHCLTLPQSPLNGSRPAPGIAHDPC